MGNWRSRADPPLFLLPRQGDLRAEQVAFAKDEVGETALWLQRTVEHLREVVKAIQETSDGMSIAAREIAEGNSAMSSRTEQQAANIEETAASMDQLIDAVRQNARHAKQADELARAAFDVAQRGEDVVQEVIRTMTSIAEGGKQIEEIVSLIDGIAFRTNILALNAAVEAARAGEHGRGFSVVAAEVRNLAGRSAQAAREVRDLIAASSGRTEAGAKLVDEAGQVIRKINSSVQEVTHFITEISTSSQEQSQGIEQINQAIAYMDQTTQQNAALGEQSAAAAMSLEEQARRLAGALKAFKVDDDQVTQGAEG